MRFSMVMSVDKIRNARVQENSTARMSSSESMAIKVIVACDYPILRSGITRVLQAEPDIEVVGEAGTGKDVIRDVQRHKPDVVLIDYLTHSLSYIETTKSIVDAIPGVSVVILANYDREDFLVRVLETGAKGYVIKREEVNVIIQSIRSVHQGDAFISPLMTSKLADDYLTRLQHGVIADPYQSLSPREREVLPLLAQGGNDREIAKGIHVSPHTVATYRKRVMKKLDLHSKTDILKYALQRGLISM